MKRFIQASMVLAVSLAAGCSDNNVAGPGPVLTGPGVLELRITVPARTSGALLIAVRGGPVDSITSGQLEAAFAPVALGDYRTILRGTIASGVIAHVWVPARERSGDYAAVVLQATDEKSYAQGATDGFPIRLVPISGSD